MSVFVDTSGFYALASREDQSHVAVTQTFRQLAQSRERLMSSSYVVSETMGLLQMRLGFEVLPPASQDYAPCQ